MCRRCRILTQPNVPARLVAYEDLADELDELAKKWSQHPETQRYSDEIVGLMDEFYSALNAAQRDEGQDRNWVIWRHHGVNEKVGR